MSVCSKRCQSYYPDWAKTTFPDTRSVLRLRRYWWTLKRYVWYISILGFSKFADKMLPSTRLGKYMLKKKSRAHQPAQYGQNLNLQPGEWVEVKSAKEIFATLDEQGRYRGLRFNREMEKFCEKEFRVYKRLDKMILESTGELRRIRTPTVMLEGVFCDGEAHGGCDRSCFCFWREAWLKRSASQASRVSCVEKP